MSRFHIWIPTFVLSVAWFTLSTAQEAGAAEPQPQHGSRTLRQIESYCTASWRNSQIPRAEWSDCSQQVFAELLQRVPRNHLANAVLDSKSMERRELNRTIWRIIKRWSRAIRHVSLGRSDWPDPSTIHPPPQDEDCVETIMKIAAERLTPRQQQILDCLRDGQSIAAISNRLAIPTQRVSDEKYRAIQKIRRYVTSL